MSYFAGDIYSRARRRVFNNTPGEIYAGVMDCGFEENNDGTQYAAAKFLKLDRHLLSVVN